MNAIETLKDFEEVVNSLPEDQKLEVLNKLEECYQMIAEARVLYDATLTYLKIRQNELRNGSGNAS